MIAIKDLRQERGCTCAPTTSSEAFGKVITFMPPLFSGLRPDGTRYWICRGCGIRWDEP